ncbi:type II toxin-antitoxin system HigB family toxin [Pedobacter africanus]|uniref:mRNA interferase HigB n=1 Tax=Pedobacter africanus TaxID=151894 RepID=A0A1W2BSD3_9SPHI|nr:type II toxin-antitoxin system HigB family toxin [Pedobacter africanus]SMC75644.1 mRNA interferase HigB [Pedobacter africanus]
MVILIKKTIQEFALKYPASAPALNKWYDVVRKANWSHFSDVRKDFNSVDYIANDRYVFNIKGNDFRIVAMIFFDKRTVFIRFVGTHREYDKIDCSII